MTAQPEVVFDARWLRTGIGRYIFTLLSDLRNHLAGLTLTCIAQPEDAERLAPLCDRVIPFQSGIYTLSEQLALPRIARGAAVFCAPHYNLPVLRTAPTIVTIHDITHVVFPQYARSLRARLYAFPMLKAACARAARIAVPSAYTKRMLIERLGADPEKIAVIPCAIAPVFQPIEKSRAAQHVKLQFGIFEPYLVCVTSAAPHKNLAALVAAYRNLRAKRREIPRLVLVLPESQPRVQSGGELHSLLADPAIHCLHGVTDSGLAALYSAALMTVIPSFEEGFGYPAAESMACGTPVVCASSASLPEVAAGCAEFFSPNSPEELEQAICRVLESVALRRDMAVKGLERAAKFTPGQTACDYATLVRSVIQDRSAAPAQLPALPASLGDQ
jgi:glycosyltransferase involved in cell wall biosynthesis